MGILRRRGTERGGYGKDGRDARLAGPAGDEDAAAAWAAARLRDHVCDSRAVGRRAARGGRLALSSAAPHGRGGLGARGVGDEGYGASRARLRADREGQKATRRRGAEVAGGGQGCESRAAGGVGAWHGCFARLAFVPSHGAASRAFAYEFSEMKLGAQTRLSVPR